MRIKRVALELSLITIVGVVSACGGAAAPATVVEPTAPAKEAMVEKPSDEAMMEEKASDEAMTEEKASDEAMVEEKAADEATVKKEATEKAMLEEKTSDEAMMEEHASDEAMMAQETAEEATMAKEGEDAMMEEKEEAMVVPAWFNAELTNVNTGETFKIADYKGKVVLVETMAVWCPTCLRQQNNVRALHEVLGERDDFVSVALDIDPNEDSEYLQAYTIQKGFDWTYAVAPPEVAREIGQLYGTQFLNPPSAPMFIIDRHGEVHPLPFGVKDAKTLQEALTRFMNEG